MLGDPEARFGGGGAGGLGGDVVDEDEHHEETDDCERHVGRHQLEHGAPSRAHFTHTHIHTHTT